MFASTLMPDSGGEYYLHALFEVVISGTSKLMRTVASHYFTLSTGFFPSFLGLP